MIFVVHKRSYLPRILSLLLCLQQCQHCESLSASHKTACPQKHSIFHPDSRGDSVQADWFNLERVTEANQRRDVLKTVLSLGLSLGFGGTGTSCWALSPEAASVAYDSYAEDYDRLDGGYASSLLGLDDARMTLFQKASGSVLEIGVGTGLNLAKYDFAKVTSLTVVDVSDGMLLQAKRRANALQLSIPVEYVKADATSELTTRFAKNSFDTVVDSFSLCVMGDMGARDCLAQMEQIVKCRRAGGRILLLENTRSSNVFLGSYQDLTAEAAASTGGKGCVYNQDVRKLIQTSTNMSVDGETSYAGGFFRAFACTRDCSDAEV